MTLADSVTLVFDFIDTMLTTIPDTPFMFLFGLAIVLILVRNVFDWIGV